MDNYPLSIKQVRRLGEGDIVWVEHRERFAQYLDGPHMHTHNRTERLLTGVYGDHRDKLGSSWDLRKNPEYYGKVFRVWLRDTEPSKEEKAAHPWPEET